MDLNSIRNRYALMSLLGGCVVILAAGLTHNLLSSTREETAANIETRQLLLAKSREVRDAIWNSREALGHFLVDPQRIENQNLVHQNIGEALMHTRKLLARTEKLTAEQQNNIEQLLERIQALDQSAVDLIQTRLTSQTQHPSLLYAAEHMLPKQRIITNQLTVAITETEEQLAEFPKTLPLYQALVETRNQWSSTIAGVRMLIASRLGSFGNTSLNSQIENIEIYLSGFRYNLKQMNKFKDFDFLGLATEQAIAEMNAQFPGWESSYRKLLRLHDSGKWRGDIGHLKGKVDPLFDEIWNILIHFDAELSKNAELDVNVISRLAQNQSYITWSIASLGIVFIIIGFIALDRYLLTPMSSITRALFMEAHGEAMAELPKARTTETRNLLAAFTAMRNEVKERQSELEHQAMHDSLTHLPNRTLLYNKLRSMVSNKTRKHDNHILIIMDLDHFKDVNDALGHQTGDLLLKEVSRRLKHLLRDSDLVARLGGDEFSILLPDTNEKEAELVAQKIIKSFEDPFKVEQHDLYVGASLGMSVFPHHGLDAETLIKRADTAMYVAKRNRLGYAFYEGFEDQDNELYLTLASDLRSAVINEQLEVHYQLKYDLKTNLAIGTEALLRWNHPQHGSISPVRLIPIAEQLGLISKITLWVMEKALQQCRTWRDEGIFLSVSVNLSVYDLQSSNIIKATASLLEKYEIPPSYLIIEITEGAMLIEPQNAIEILRQLDAMGVRIAIDDFGSGYSSLGYLKQLPVDELKIDKSFVIDMIDNDNDAVIVRSTIDLAHNLGLQVVAEGVENLDIYQLLEILRCDTAQGFYMCRPVGAEQIRDYLDMSPNLDGIGFETDNKQTGTI